MSSRHALGGNHVFKQIIFIISLSTNKLSTMRSTTYKNYSLIGKTGDMFLYNVIFDTN